MTDDNNTRCAARRRVLKSMAAGGGAVVAAKSVPGEWTRPVVDAVLLPAHAQTTQTFVAAAGAAAATDIGRRETDSRFAWLLDGLVPNAHANGIKGNVYVCVTPTSDGTRADVEVRRWAPGDSKCPAGTAFYVELFTAESIPVPSAGNKLQFGGNECDSFNTLLAVPQASVDVTSVENGAQGQVMVEGMPFAFDIGPGTCSPPQCCGGDI